MLLLYHADLVTLPEKLKYAPLSKNNLAISILPEKLCKIICTQEKLQTIS